MHRWVCLVIESTFVKKPHPNPIELPHRAMDQSNLLAQMGLLRPRTRLLEVGVQVYPVQINADPGTFYWLPSYFTQWYGVSLACPDDRAAKLDASALWLTRRV